MSPRSLASDWHPLEDEDEPVIERDVPPVIHRIERAWRCRAVRLGAAFGGLWAFTRGDRQAVSFGVIVGEGQGMPPEARAAADPLVRISGLPLILVAGEQWAKVTGGPLVFRPV